MNTDQREILAEKQKKFYAVNLSKLEEGLLSVNEFLSSSEKVSQELVKEATIYTTNFKEWAGYLRKNHEYAAEGIILHESQHAKVAEKYGLTVKYGLVLVTPTDDFHIKNKIPLWAVSSFYLQAFISENSREVAKREQWDKNKLLKFLHEIANAPDDPSDVDKII
ncbi:hypothetical protein HZA97_03495 [Candidatus Woesearchaeota archaeon]|nr:hypothetical protein [Candidatus Woesearchaeota archaeon]